MSETQTRSGSQVAEFLKDHPRMMGVLFTLCLFLTQAGNVAAANGGTIS
ncbi:DUF7503 family protein [Natronococcus pandeyae]|nr:hypothetical protein [Natronococcus pandeyae]